MPDQQELLAAYPQQDMAAVDAYQLAEEVRRLVAMDMQVEAVEVARAQKQQGAVVLRGRLLRPSEQIFPRWLAELNRRGFTPLLRPASDEHPQQVKLHIVKGVAPKTEAKPWINVLLFVVTVISTLFAGLFFSNVPVDTLSELFLPRNILSGWPYAATLLTILFVHEFGHYFAARYHNVAVTLPYFIPLPLPGSFGTLGAFIRMKEPVPDRRKLFDIGVAGPLAGLILAVPLLIFGLMNSPVMVPQFTEGAWLEGNSIFYYFAKIAIFGKALPNPATGEDVIMNQVTMAAWFGLLVTALNLLPIGQLDGGHTVFAMFGEKSRYVNVATGSLMAVLAVAGLAPLQQLFPGLQSIGFSGWFVWLALILFVIGPFHPPALDDVTRLDRKRQLVGYAVIAVFILIFVPVPLRML